MLDKWKNLLFFLIIPVLFLPLTAHGEMWSASYYLYADSIGWGGGDISSSTVYTMSSAIGEWGAETVSSSIYQLKGGLLAMDKTNSLEISISSQSLNLGTLSVGSVASASTVVTVTTDSFTGYSLSIGSLTGTMPTPVVDGQTVTAGTEAYGMSVAGVDKAFSGDKAVAADLVLASSTGASNATTTLTFKASMGSSYSSTITYTQTVILTGSANYAI